MPLAFSLQGELVSCIWLSHNCKCIGYCTSMVCRVTLDGSVWFWGIFCYEHLVTTFTQLNIACVVFFMERTAEIEVTKHSLSRHFTRGSQNKDEVSSSRWKPCSLEHVFKRRFVLFAFPKTISNPHWQQRYNFQPNNRFNRLLEGFRPHHI